MTKETEKLMGLLQQKLADERIPYCIAVALRDTNLPRVSSSVNGSIQEIMYMISLTLNHVSNQSGISEEELVMLLEEASQLKEDVKYDQSGTL